VSRLSKYSLRLARLVKGSDIALGLALGEALKEASIARLIKRRV
jgi:hypothetical protein